MALKQLQNLMQYTYRLHNYINNDSLSLTFAGISGHFNENGLLMDAAEKEILFYSKVPTSEADLEAALTMRSYKNSLVQKRTITNNYQALKRPLMS